jgi:glycosyltransferase involved in cell wall biosynthesis
MKIAQVAPMAERVPPALYGGTERIVAYLTEELVALGHDVTLFASGDSITSAQLDAVCPRALRLCPGPVDPMATYAFQMERLAQRAHEFDIIHFHTEWVHMPLFSRIGVPFLTTLHGRLDSSNVVRMLNTLASMRVVSISDAQRHPIPDADWLGTVLHGLPVNLLRPQLRAGRYLAFLGRICAEKRPDMAIRLARAAGLPIRLAAKVDGADQAYFETVIRPLLDAPGVEFIGEISESEKASFLGRASALLFPIDWPEPFGLVMIEAMACGTPVIAMRRGSASEVIRDGVSGYVADSEPEFLAAISHVGRCARAAVRQDFEARFTSRRMAEDYVRLYEDVVRSSTAIVARIVPGHASLGSARAASAARSPGRTVATAASVANDRAAKDDAGG